MDKIKNLKEKYKRFLPSKKFITLASVSLVLIVIIFIIFFMASGKESFFTKDEKDNIPLKVENQSITELIQTDTDGDGIADWEEALWGTNKNKKITFNDTPDATYIDDKKKELKIEQGASVNEQNLTETEKFAREFFVSYSAMKSSGQVNSDTINSFSDALGQKIVNPNLVDRYKSTDVKIGASNDTVAQQKYYADVKSLFKNYQKDGIGNELDIVSHGLSAQLVNGTTNNIDQYEQLPIIASAYKNFAQKMMEINVPQSLVEYHLNIVNNSNNTGISVLNMQKIVNDPIIGLSGLSQYQKYSNDLIKAVAGLETYLLKQ